MTYGYPYHMCTSFPHLSLGSIYTGKKSPPGESQSLGYSYSRRKSGSYSKEVEPDPADRDSTTCEETRSVSDNSSSPIKLMESIASAVILVGVESVGMGSSTIISLPFFS